MNNWFLRNPEQLTHVKEAAEKAPNDQISKEGCFGDQYFSFFHPNTSIVVISLNKTNVGLHGSNKQLYREAYEGFILIMYHIFYLQLHLRPF